MNTRSAKRLLMNRIPFLPKLRGTAPVPCFLTVVCFGGRQQESWPDPVRCRCRVVTVPSFGTRRLDSQKEFFEIVKAVGQGSSIALGRSRNHDPRIGPGYGFQSEPG